jgi:hypothetical protein
VYRKAALAVAWKSPDLAVVDRRRIVTAIKKELEEFDAAIGQGASGVAPRDLNGMMEVHARSHAQSAVLGEMTCGEVFA